MSGPAAPFSDEEMRRYSRQILLREVGGRGQRRLTQAAPVLLCDGAVGELAARYLRRGGVSGLVVYAPDTQAAALDERLRTDGPPAVTPGCRALGEAPPWLRTLADAAPGFTLGVLEPPLEGPDPVGESVLWARCSGAQGVLGQGRAELDAEAAGGGGEAAGDASVLIGSALALLVMQRLLGLPTPRRLSVNLGDLGRQGPAVLQPLP